MQRVSILLFLLVLCSATAMQAQAPAPKPDPGLKKLHAVVGHWTFEGESQPGPLGPGGKFSGEDDCQMILGGFFFQCRMTGKTATGESRSMEIDGYDPVNKNLSSEFYGDDGSRFSGVLTITGNTWTWAGKSVTAGKEMLYKATFVLAPDLMSATDKTETSIDGKTWTTADEAKWTKVQPAPKK